MMASAAQPGAWSRFWFEPRSTAPVELFRIVYGLLATVWLVSLLPVYETFLGPDPAVPEAPPTGAGTWTLFTLVGHSPLIWAIWLVGFAGAVALMLGLGTRLAAVVLFAVAMSLTRQAPSVFHAPDQLMRILAFYVMLMPAGSAVSLDRLRHDPAGFWVFPRRAPWALRLAQIQLSVIYLSTVWEKAGGVTWREGSAISYALRSDSVSRLPLPAAITDSVVLTQLATFGTLAVEASIGILVWNRVARPWVLSLGVLLHLSIEVSMTVGAFSFGMMTLYLVFVSPQTATRVFAVVRARLARRRSRRTPGHADGDPATSDVVVRPAVGDGTHSADEDREATEPATAKASTSSP